MSRLFLNLTGFGLVFLLSFMPSGANAAQRLTLFNPSNILSNKFHIEYFRGGSENDIQRRIAKSYEEEIKRREELAKKREKRYFEVFLKDPYKRE